MRCIFATGQVVNQIPAEVTVNPVAEISVLCKLATLSTPAVDSVIPKQDVAK